MGAVVFMWKKILSVIMISLSIVSLDTFVQSNLLASNTTNEQLLDQIIAVVNDDIITQSELDHALVITKKQFMQHQTSPPNEKIFIKKVLEKLIYQKLQFQLVKRNHIQVSNDEINTAITQIATANHLSQIIFKQKLTQQGISYRMLRSRLIQQLLISKLQQQVLQNNISITKSDIATFQKQHTTQIVPTRYRVVSVLIPLPLSSTQAQINHAKRKADLVLKQLQKASNVKIAMRTHLSSTDLGWRSVDELPQVFAKTVVKMKPNELAGPIQAPNGFHIIKLLDKEEKKTISDQQIQQIIYQQKVERALQKWLVQLRSSAYVHIYKDF